MNRTATVIVVVIIIIVIGIVIGISYSNNQPALPPADQSQTAANQASSSDQSQSPAVSAPVPQNHMVVYTDRGFSPASLTIANGDSVTWTNNSSGRLWVASDPHPTHTDLPGFDEKAFIMPGASWTYTFTVTGSHGYHNHANPSTRGTVVVQ